MLKKMTVFSLLLLLVCFLVGIVLIPITVRDVVKNRDSIIGTFVNSSEIVTLNASEHPSLLLDFSHSNLTIEPSTDANIYLKTEGFFGNQFEIVTTPSTFEKKPVTKLSLFKEDLFFDKNTPSYLFSKQLHNESNVSVILRVPENVSIYTTGNDSNIYYACSNNVKFLNIQRYQDAVERKHRKNESYDFTTEITSENPIFVSYIDLRQEFENELNSAKEQYYSIGMAEDDQLWMILGDICTLYRARLDTLLMLSDSVKLNSELAALTAERLDEFLELRKQAEGVSVLYALGSGEYNSDSVDEAVQSAHMAQSAFERMLVEFLDTATLPNQVDEYAASAPEMATKEGIATEAVPAPETPAAAAAPAVPETPETPVTPGTVAAPTAAESFAPSKLIRLSTKLISKL